MKGMSFFVEDNKTAASFLNFFKTYHTILKVVKFSHFHLGASKHTVDTDIGVLESISLVETNIFPHIYYNAQSPFSSKVINKFKYSRHLCKSFILSSL